MRTIVLIAFIGLLVPAASSAEMSAPADLPAWLQAKIVSSSRNAARPVYRTTYQGNSAFYVSPACCDVPSELYDESGKLLCYPSGGFAGGDGKCPDFIADPKRLTLAWPASPESAPAKR